MEKGYETLAGSLHGAGMDTLFGVMGETNLDLVAYLVERYGVRYIAARHEAGAMAMATGYAQASGRVGFATVTCGPGLTNAITPLVTAVRDQARTLLITGQLPLATIGRSQTFDQAALLAPTGAAVIQVETAAALNDAVTEALERIEGRHGPAVLNILAPVLDGPCDPSPPALRHATPMRRQVEIDAAALAACADILANAKRPVILAGRGAVQSGAGPALRTLAHRTNAALATTLLAKGLFAGDARDLGIVGGISMPDTVAALAACDGLIAFGASLNGWTTRAGALCPDARVVQVDHDRGAGVRATVPVQLGVAGDANDVAMRLSDLAAAGGHSQIWWKGLDLAPGEQVPAASALSDPRHICRALNEALPASRTVTVDAGQFLEFPCKFLDVPDERGFIFTLGFGTVGLGLATAIGAALGRPERLSIAVVGDGGFMMSMQEIETAARHRIALVLLVIDDGGYGAEIKHLEDRGWDTRLARFVNPDIAAVAASLGARAVAIHEPSEIAAAVADVARLDGPLVLHAKVDPSTRAEWMAIMHAARQHAARQQAAPLQAQA